MNIIVTGAAGFIGSHLSEKLLLDTNNKVIGIDGLLDPTTKSLKKRNLQSLLKQPRFSFVEKNLLDIDWNHYLKDIDVIFHLAGMPGVRSSWGNNFDQYILHNITVTQRLLEACRTFPIKKLVYASTSSIYGQRNGKVPENTSPVPLSPYGVSKLTGEHLCHVYYKNDGVPIVILRYFTVYGPRQRSDMAFHRFIKCFIENKPIPVFGDGEQSRDFTYVDDCVNGTASVLRADPSIIGETFNIGGLERSTVLNTISILEKLFNKNAHIMFTGNTRGEPKHTWADISKAQKILNYQPTVSLETGLRKEIEYLKHIY